MTNHHHAFREWAADIKRLGFEVVGFDGNNHHRLYHPDTDTYTSVARTPSDWRSRRNELARLERIAGRKLPRPNAAHYRTRRTPVTDMQMTDHERRQSDTADKLLAKAAQLRTQFADLISGANLGRNAAAEARHLIDQYQRIADGLAVYHRTIPPINGETP